MNKQRSHPADSLLERLRRARGPALLACLFVPVWAGAQNPEREPDGFFHWMLPAQEMRKQFAAPAVPVAPARGQSSAESEYERLAWEFLAGRAQGLSEPRAELLLYRHDVGDDGHHHLRFFHEIDGVRLGDTELLVHITASGTVFGFNGYAEPGMDSLRARLRAHLGNGGLRIGREEVLQAVRDDAGSQDVELVRLQARVDDRYDVVYWRADARIDQNPHLVMYHIGDDPQTQILSKTVLFRSFLPVQ